MLSLLTRWAVPRMFSAATMSPRELKIGAAIPAVRGGDLTDRELVAVLPDSHEIASHEIASKGFRRRQRDLGHRFQGAGENAIAYLRRGVCQEHLRGGRGVDRESPADAIGDPEVRPAVAPVDANRLLAVADPDLCRFAGFVRQLGEKRPE